MRRRLYFLTPLLALSACHGQGPDSNVESWWYTETPQGYSDQGTSVTPTGSPVPVSGGAKGTHQGDKR